MGGKQTVRSGQKDNYTRNHKKSIHRNTVHTMQCHHIQPHTCGIKMVYGSRGLPNPLFSYESGNYFGGFGSFGVWRGGVLLILRCAQHGYLAS